MPPVMPSRQALRDAWTAADRQQYASAVAQAAPAERGCVKVSGDSVSYSKDCFKKAFAGLRGKNGPLSTVWSE